MDKSYSIIFDVFPNDVVKMTVEWWGTAERLKGVLEMVNQQKAGQVDAQGSEEDA
jgi:hypothetical protein